MRFSATLPTLMHERRKPGQRRPLIAAHLTQLRHPHHHRQRCPHPTPGNAAHQIEPKAQILVLAQRRHQAHHLRIPPLLEPLDVGLHDPPRTLYALMIPGDSIDIEGFTFEGWEQHPWAIKDVWSTPAKRSHPERTCCRRSPKTRNRDKEVISDADGPSKFSR
jgi:hypothetical protein